MLKTLRTLTLVAAAMAMSTGPLTAQGDCAFYVSGWFNGSPATGYLLGQSKVTVESGFDFYLNGSVSQEFCVGTYQMRGRKDGKKSFILKLRCDTYTIWGLF